MRQFVSDKGPGANGLLEIEKKDFHYLRQVLRLSSGDMINVAVPGGLCIDMTVSKIDDGAKKIVLQKCAELSVQKNQFTEYTLLQFIPKPQKMELIVRQATECGVSTIVPVIGEYTQGGTEKPLLKPERFNRIIREARQQSGSPVETKILLPCTLNDAMDSCQCQKKIVLYERNEKTIPLARALEMGDGEKANGKKINSLALAVGPEGGISPAEFESLLSRGFLAVHFNTNILRCETAALYGIAAAQAALDN